MVDKKENQINRWEAQFLFITKGVSEGRINYIKAMSDCFKIARRMCQAYQESPPLHGDGEWED